MVRVNNLANDAASDQVKAAPESSPFASSIDLFKSDNSCSRSGSLPFGFDNNFSISGLDTGKGTGFTFKDNMPVLRTDTKGFDDNMPILRTDTKGFDDNMPVLQFRSDDIYNIAPNVKPDCFIDIGISDDIGARKLPDTSITDDIGARRQPDLGITDDIGPNARKPSIDFRIPENTWGALDTDLLFGDMPLTKHGSGGGGGGSSHSDRSIANRVPDEDVAAPMDRPRGSAGYGDAPINGSTDELPKLPLEGKSILELDPKINPRLGCALAVSGALHELDPSFPVTNNNKQLAQLLKQHGYEAVPQDGSIKGDNMNPGDVVIGQRPAGMPGHAAIYKGQGKIYENDSDSGTIIGNGNLDRFNDKMHDQAGRWNKNGFSDVTVYRKVPVIGSSNY